MYLFPVLRSHILLSLLLLLIEVQPFLLFLLDRLLSETLLVKIKSQLLYPIEQKFNF